MVSKIIVYDDDDEETTEEAEPANLDFQTQMLAYMQSMDWKLWEILKIQQKQELVSEAPMPPTVKPNSIIVDEDDT
tara:strand:- start:2 stop:229 length:228 start_codon:yes stop_codon:yes gene_type:complete